MDPICECGKNTVVIGTTYEDSYVQANFYCYDCTRSHWKPAMEVFTLEEGKQEFNRINNLPQ